MRKGRTLSDLFNFIGYESVAIARCAPRDGGVEVAHEKHTSDIQNSYGSIIVLKVFICSDDKPMPLLAAVLVHKS